MRLKTASKVLGVLLLIGAATISSPGFAQSPSAGDVAEGRIGVLDVAEVRRSAKMANDMDRQINEQRAKFGEQMRGKEVELRKAAEELERQRVVLAPDAYTKKREELQQQTSVFQAAARQRQASFNAMRAAALKAFQDELNKAVRAYARANKYFLIVGRRDVVFFEPPLSVTAEVIALMDKNTPTFALPEPKVDGKK